MKRLVSILSCVTLLLIALTMSMTVAQEETLTETPVATALPPDVTPTAVPKPLPFTSVEQDGVTVELYFEAVKQGRAALAHVYGEGVIGARARLFERVTEFFAVEDEGYYGLLSVGIEQTPRDYEMEVYAILEDDSQITIPVTITVELGGFIKQTIELPPDRMYLTDPEVERTEFARLAAIFENTTSERLWDSGEVDFQLPINAPITSQFGALRVFNGTTETLHTGWDLQASTGTPVMTAAAGKVAFAGSLDIRGNVVIIDHGYALFTTYAHLSVMNVTRGQSVSKGQIVGMSGNTGRSTGPHQHWEVNVNGEWVDSVDFLRLWLPG